MKGNMAPFQVIRQPGEAKNHGEANEGDKRPELADTSHRRHGSKSQGSEAGDLGRQFIVLANFGGFVRVAELGVPGGVQSSSQPDE